MTIERYRGDTKRLAYTIKDSFGAAINVTGWSFLMTINAECNPDDTANQQAQITGVIDDAAAGKIYFPFSGVSLDPGTYYFDVQVSDGNAETETLEKSEMKIIQDITKA